MNDDRNITRGQLGKIEAVFLAKAGIHTAFSLAFARHILERTKDDPTPQFLERLQSKGWIRHIRRGRFAVIPFSSGEDRSPQLHEFVVAMELVSPRQNPKRPCFVKMAKINRHSVSPPI